MSAVKPLHVLPGPTFHFNGIDIRHAMIDGDPWFVGSDVLRVLFGDADGKGNNYRKLDASEKTTVQRINLGLPPGKPMALVAESGLYKLIMRCDKPVAKAFQDWVTREVLPSVRKTGGYLLNEDMRTTAAADSREEFPLPASFSDALRKLANEVERREQSEKIARELAAAREADRPKVEFAEEYMASKGTLSLREAANTFGMGQNDFIGLLIEKKVLYRNVKGQNVAVATQLFAERFVQRTGSQNGRSYISTRVTPDGMTWIATQLMRWRPKGASGHRKGS